MFGSNHQTQCRLEALEDIPVLREGEVANEWFFVRCLDCGDLAFPYNVMKLAIWKNQLIGD